MGLCGVDTAAGAVRALTRDGLLWWWGLFLCDCLVAGAKRKWLRVRFVCGGLERVFLGCKIGRLYFVHQCSPLSGIISGL
jgi:hypothetical protein